MYTSIVNRIRLVMKEKKISQVKLAAILEIDYKTFNNYMTSNRWMDLETFRCICKVLDISADFLLGLSDENKFYG